MDQQQKNKEDDDFSVQQQINRYSNPLPEVPRGDSQNFFKQIHRDQNHSIRYIQMGFLVANLSPSLYDLVSVIINDIHCNSEHNLKLIIDGDQLWITSTIVYPQHSIGNITYNIIQSNLAQSLQSSREILIQILELCQNGTEKAKSDQEILKEIRAYYNKIFKCFKDPNSDY